MDSRNAISELICRSCMALDAKDFNAYLALCDANYHYAITAYSPEIRKDMTWLEHDKAGMQLLFGNLPKHNSDQSPLSRHVTVYTITPVDDAKEARVVSALQVFRTSLDGGATELFAVGTLHDTVSLADGEPKLLDRNVKLQTRMLGFGYHIPL
ncbi:aromatic-ring-hydroxylating dioxygenase subunit beta [Methylibium sp.]|uniref:aromatic-ring-hydroxylating dioxygenase subunit beta n=1 Tax=Methylibium sp. TaxID=2067992 RepID=UPI00286AAEBC|nr:aromatic-ring-hydroxylating dioxygenase subunit beta [Methylibium sp.]